MRFAVLVMLPLLPGSPVDGVSLLFFKLFEFVKWPSHTDFSLRKGQLLCVIHRLKNQSDDGYKLGFFCNKDLSVNRARKW